MLSYHTLTLGCMASSILRPDEQCHAAVAEVVVSELADLH